MPRIHDDWLRAYVEYAQHTEAPVRMHFWSGVSAVAGALRRRVWIDQAYFKWYPNFYICMVAPPGVVSKSTTAGIAMDLLKLVPGIKFGPNIVTWPELVAQFASATEAFEYKGEYHAMSPLTLESSEFGNLVNPADKEMVDLLVSLWDGKQGAFTKATKTSGNDSVENPWINLIACTTPSWIAGNFPEYMIGGGFTSRTIFVYADTKAKRVAYPRKHVPLDLQQIAESLVSDLTHIATTLCGEYILTAEAESWGEAWYEQHWDTRPKNLDDDRFGGYVARKQTHIHKLAMVMAAAQGDDLVIQRHHLEDAYTMVTDLEPDMNFVFAKIGKSDTSFYTDKLVVYVHQQGEVSIQDAYRQVHTYFPSMREFEDVVLGCIRAGFFRMEGRGESAKLVAGRPLDRTSVKGA